MQKPMLSNARRRFIASAGAICTGTVAQAATRVTAMAPAHAGADARFTAGKFSQCLGSEFKVQAMSGNAAPVSLSLSRVVASPFVNDAGAFSIDLTGAGARFAQDTYAVSHPVLGQFAALLVPAADGHTLTGVFHSAA